ncbi:MAG TPA: ATP-binding protein [Gemmatimonadaceae bacterium]|nr:ATP-binding protein [Gemmatimonadaceae bacterium]
MRPDEDTPSAPIDPDALIASLPCGVVSFDDEGRVLFTNATLRAMLGYHEGELEGGRVEHMLTVAGKIFYQTHLFPLLRLHGAAREVFLLLRSKSGGDVGALANVSRTEHEGTAVSHCVLMEVHERRKYEEELLRARQAADRANAELETKARALEEVLAREREQAVELEQQQFYMQEQAAELEAQQEELQAAYDQLVARQHDLELARAAAEDASRAKSQFLTTMSHELRTPLNAIGGYVQLMEMEVQGPITEQQRHSLDRIARSQRHLLRLVNEVLNLARIEAGRVDFALEDLVIADVMASVVPMVEPQLASAGLRLESSVDPELRARADWEKTQQILINLLTNASKFTPAGGCVNVAAIAESDARRLHLRVADTGIGISADRLASVFEPFVQVHTGPARRAEGTGLGLAISRDLARGMGGDLTAESTPGMGSIFTLSLPLA